MPADASTVLAELVSSGMQSCCTACVVLLLGSSRLARALDSVVLCGLQLLVRRVLVDHDSSKAAGAFGPHGFILLVRRRTKLGAGRVTEAEHKVV